jgi:thymidylate synthase (FAD)
MDHTNQIQLLGHYGSDETHAASAWTSTIRDITDEKRARIPAMLKQLADAGHHSPFEKSTLHFLLTVEQASHIHLLKHRIGVSINGESARYKELKDDRFYVPSDWQIENQEILERHCKQCFTMYHACLRDLEIKGYSRKRAKESARFFLPYASQIQLDVSFNWRSFHHFLGLRKKANAQDEIHEIAGKMLDLVFDIEGCPFKHTIEAFGYTNHCIGIRPSVLSVS